MLFDEVKQINHARGFVCLLSHCVYYIIMIRIRM